MRIANVPKTRGSASIILTLRCRNYPKRWRTVAWVLSAGRNYGLEDADGAGGGPLKMSGSLVSL